MKYILIFLCLFGLIHATPPRTIPPQLYDEFTLNGEIPVTPYYRDDSYSSDQPLIYDVQTLEMLKNKALRKETNYYGETDLLVYRAIETYLDHIQGKKVAVMGSIIPWYEAMILAYGGYPVTIEYNKIISEDPNLRTITVAEFEKNPEQFDAILSISSFEHDGLGRYGDPINPRGDLDAMEKARKMLKSGGIMILAVPVGRDCLAWNAHRIYGRKRLPILFNGWKRLDSYGFHETDFDRENPEQPVFVLTPLDKTIFQ